MGDRPTEPVQSAALGQCRAPLPTLTVWISHSLVRGYIGGRQFPLTVALVKAQTTGRASHLSDPRFRPSAHFACWERGATTGERRQNRRVSARQAATPTPNRTAPLPLRTGPYADRFLSWPPVMFRDGGIGSVHPDIPANPRMPLHPDIRGHSVGEPIMLWDRRAEPLVAYGECVQAVDGLR